MVRINVRREVTGFVFFFFRGRKLGQSLLRRFAYHDWWSWKFQVGSSPSWLRVRMGCAGGRIMCLPCLRFSDSEAWGSSELQPDVRARKKSKGLLVKYFGRIRIQNLGQIGGKNEARADLLSGSLWHQKNHFWVFLFRTIWGAYSSHSDFPYSIPKTSPAWSCHIS